MAKPRPEKGGPGRPTQGESGYSGEEFWGSTRTARVPGSKARKHGPRTRRFSKKAEREQTRNRGSEALAHNGDTIDPASEAPSVRIDGEFGFTPEAFREELPEEPEQPSGVPARMGLDNGPFSRVRSKVADSISRLSGVRKQGMEKLLRRKLRLQAQLADLERQLAEEMSASMPASLRSSGAEAEPFGLKSTLSRARERRARARLGLLSWRQARDAAEARRLQRELEDASAGSSGPKIGRRGSRRGPDPVVSMHSPSSRSSSPAAGQDEAEDSSDTSSSSESSESSGPFDFFPASTAWRTLLRSASRLGSRQERARQRRRQQSERLGPLSPVFLDSALAHGLGTRDDIFDLGYASAPLFLFQVFSGETEESEEGGENEERSSPPDVPADPAESEDSGAGPSVVGDGGESSNEDTESAATSDRSEISGRDESDGGDEADGRSDD